jgi:hypothetical protein
MLLSQVRRMREFVCVLISVFLQSECWRCQYSSAYVAVAIRFVRLALKVVMQNYEDFVVVILPYQL